MSTNRLDAAHHHLFERIQQRYRMHPDDTALVLLDDAGEQGLEVSWRELACRVEALAAVLRQEGAQGQAVLLLFTPGLDYVTALLACGAAGCMATPAYPPLNQRQATRIHAILADSQASLVLTNVSWLKPALLQPASGQTRAVKCLNVDQVNLHPSIHQGEAHADWQDEDVAILQYTSGSTGEPKGVMLSVANLTHNVRHMAERFGCEPGQYGVTWLPPYHDMGLLGGIFLPLYSGLIGVSMSPAAFAQRPVRWLQAMSRYHGVISGGPNTAYQLCADKIPDEQLAGLDLSAWRFAVNGAEPVRQDTMHRFSRKFARCGFSADAFHPSYGLAESSLYVAGGPWLPGEASDVHYTCGTPGQQIRIVDPQGACALPEGQVGEIWLASPSVAKGYWQRDDLNAQVFQAHLDDDPHTRYLRTGDLGQMLDGQLVVSGRIKDVINLGGRKLYPQDIEAIAQQAHPASRLGGGAAFGIEQAERMRLILVQELEPRLRADPDEVSAAIRQAVASELGVVLDELVLVRAGMVPRTSSGKVRRSTCQQQYLDGQIEAQSLSTRNQADQLMASAPEATGVHVKGLPHLMRLLAVELGLPTNLIKQDRTLAELGLDSLGLLNLQMALGEESLDGVSLETLFHTPLHRLAEHLTSRPLPLASTLPLPNPEDAHTPFPLTPLQQAYVLGRMQEGDQVSTHVYLEYDVTHLDLYRLEHAWQRLVDRHDMLRLQILDHELQRTTPPGPHQPWRRHDWRAHPNPEQELQALRAAMSHEVLPLKGPFHHVCLSLGPDERSRLHLSLDLLATDAASLMIVMREWRQCYEQPQAPLPDLRITFRSHVLQQQANPDSRRDASRVWWAARLPTIPGAPQLPLIDAGHVPSPPRFKRHQHRIEPDAWQGLRQLAARWQVTPAMLLLQSFAECLGHWSPEPRFSISLTLFNRPTWHPQVADLVGDFTDVLLQSFDLTAPGDLAHRTLSTQSHFLTALAHRHFSGLEVQRAHRQLHGQGPLPLSAIVFTCLLQECEDAAWLGRPLQTISQTPQVWLDHQIHERQGYLELSWDVRENAFPPDMVADMFRCYTTFLIALATCDEAMGRQLYMASPPGRAHHPQGDRITSDCALHAGFLNQCAQSPDALAIIDSQSSHSYLEAEQQSRAIAQCLLAHGAEANDIVAIMLPKGASQVLAALGVSRSGAAYLPIDPAWPAQRITHLLHKAGAKFVLTDSGHRATDAWPKACLLINLNTDLPRPAVSTLPAIRPGQLAYVIYTSGSTGEPKGVAIAHDAVRNTIDTIHDLHPLHQGDRVLALSSLCFDLSVWDIFGTLAAGASIVIPEKHMLRDPAALNRFCHTHAVSVWNSVPALMQIQLDHAESLPCGLPPSLRWVMLSGDYIPLSLPDRIRHQRPDCLIWSLGGATEAAIWSIYYQIEAVSPAWRSIPYGRALAGQQVCVLDHQGSERPVGVAGEIHIGGKGLATGYWQDEVRTQASFITHPRTLQRYYRTGDWGRYMPDGNIEFLGRMDNQVKVAGHRIELGEIEHALNSHHLVRHAAAVVTHDDGQTRLLAFVVAHAQTDQRECVSSLRTHLSQRLPAYMVPSSIALLSELPLNSNGKVDRGALCRLAGSTKSSEQDGIKPNTPPTLLGAWLVTLQGLFQELHERAPPNPDMALQDLGYTSIDIMRTANALEKRFGLRPPVSLLFESPSLRHLAQFYVEQECAPTTQPASLPRTQRQDVDEAICRALQTLMHGHAQLDVLVLDIEVNARTNQALCLLGPQADAPDRDRACFDAGVLSRDIPASLKHAGYGSHTVSASQHQALADRLAPHTPRPLLYAAHLSPLAVLPLDQEIEAMSESELKRLLLSILADTSSTESGASHA